MGLQPRELDLQPGGVGLQPGGIGLQPGGVGLQPGGIGLQPGGIGLQPGDADQPSRGQGMHARGGTRWHSVAALNGAVAGRGAGWMRVGAEAWRVSGGRESPSLASQPALPGRLPSRYGGVGRLSLG